MTKLLLTFCLLIGFANCVSQTNTYRVYLKDKGGLDVETSANAKEIALNTLTPRCLQRRAKSLPQAQLISNRDLPIPRVYVDSIAANGIVLAMLKWDNFLVVSCTEQQRDKIKTLSFVSDVQPTQTLAKKLNAVSEAESPSLTQFLYSNCGSFSYGPSWVQNSILQTNKLHEFGYVGTNTIVGVLDNGFDRSNVAFSQAKILGEYDFIQRDSVTKNQAGDPESQDGHGTPVLSVLCGYLPDTLIGTAPFANYLLAKTEDMKGEKNYEEDLFAAGIEWMESKGADVSSSSLAYFAFDSAEYNHSFSSLDGSTTLTARYLNWATKLGMICVTAAGNSGGISRTISTPADADSALTIGAVTIVNDTIMIAGFSSKGPNNKGTLKPDVTSLGTNVFGANKDVTTFGSFVGTSFACPAVAGATALLVEAFPEKATWEIREMMRMNATKSNSPDSSWGWGIPQIFTASTLQTILISPPLQYIVSNTLYIGAKCASNLKIDSVQLKYTLDGTSYISKATPVRDSLYVVAHNAAQFSGKMLVVDSIIAHAATGLKRAIRGSSFIIAERNIPCGISGVDLPVSVELTENFKQLESYAVPFGSLYLNTPNSTEVSDVKITNSLGQIVLQNSNETTLRVDTLPRGFYIINYMQSLQQKSISLLIY